MKPKSRALCPWLLIMACSLAGRNALAVGGEDRVARRVFDLRLTGGLGVFLYPQKVDGGYYVNNVPYDLSWYGFQAQITGDAQFFLPWYRRLSVGVGGASFLAPSPHGMSSDYSVNVAAKGDGAGVYGGLSASYWWARWRVNFLGGYGGAGVSSNYGGWGPTFSLGATYLLGNGDWIGGLGAKYVLMILHDPGNDDTRAESGGYMAMLLEASIDWAPRLSSE
jgi:hypothetical protein